MLIIIIIIVINSAFVNAPYVDVRTANRGSETLFLVQSNKLVCFTLYARRAEVVVFC